MKGKIYYFVSSIICALIIISPVASAADFFDAADTETINNGTRTGGTFNNCIDTSDNIDCIYQEEDTGVSAATGNMNITIGSFGTTTQAATNTVTISGWDFDPTADIGKFAILWWNGDITTNNNTQYNNHKAGFGIAVSSTERGSIATHSENGISPVDSGSAISTSDAVHIIGPNEVTDGRLDFNSWTSDGMQFIIDDQFTQNYTIQYSVKSGDNIANISTGAFQWNTVTGIQNITGLGFQGELLIVMAYDGSSGPPATSGDASLTFGAATNTTNQYTYMGWANGGDASSDTFSYVQSGELLALGDATAGPEHRAEFNAWLADGFQINITETDASIRHSLYIVINGGQWSLGDFQTRTDTNDIIETGTGFEPLGIIAVSHNRPESTADTPDDNARWSMGAAINSSTELTFGILDEDNKNPPEVQIGANYNNYYINLDETNTEETLYLDALGASGFCGVKDGDVTSDTGDLGAELTELIDTLDTSSPYISEYCWVFGDELDNREQTIPAGSIFQFIAHWGTDSGGGPSATINIGFYEFWPSNSTVKDVICETTAQDPTENTNDEIFSCNSASETIFTDTGDAIGLLVGLVCNERCTSKVPTFEYHNLTDSDSRIILQEEPLNPKGLMQLSSMDSNGFTSNMSIPDSSAAFVWYLAGAANPVATPVNYTFEMLYDWIAVPAANNHTLIVECTYLSAIENVGVYIYNFTTPTWILAYVCDSATDVTYDTYVLGTGEYNSGAPRIRFNGSLEITDTIQDSFTIDYAVIWGQTIDVVTPALSGADMLMWFLLAIAVFSISLGAHYMNRLFISFGGFVILLVGLFIIFPSSAGDITNQTAALLLVGIGLIITTAGALSETV